MQRRAWISRAKRVGITRDVHFRYECDSWNVFTDFGSQYFQVRRFLLLFLVSSITEIFEEYMYIFWLSLDEI